MTSPANATNEPPRRAREAEPARRRRPLWRTITVALAAVIVVGLTIPAVTILLPWWSDANVAPVQARLAAGRSHTCAITNTGEVKCWGDNSSGQLGTGTVTAATAAVVTTGLPKATALAAGGDHTCALTTTGGVSCWGANGSGQLGDGGTTDSATPVPVAGLGEGVLAIAAGESHSCALLRDRSVRCWGDNGSGELGTGDTSPSLTPIAVKDLPTRSTGVGVGSGFTCVVFTGRTVRCWGDNADGQLGVGDQRSRLRWEPVIGLPRVSTLSVGDAHACAVTREGSVMCWGANNAGQLGVTMEATNATAPLAPPGLTEHYTSVAAGYTQTCALGESKHVTCWGGEPADTASDPSVARDVPGLSGATSVSVGAFHACATTDDGIWCWGRNDLGQLGTGGASGPEPRQVEGL